MAELIVGAIVLLALLGGAAGPARSHVMTGDPDSI